MPLPQFEAQPQKDPITLEKERLFEAVKNIPVRVGVHSGKGGVGKTFVATQLALALAEQGKRVGLIDADVDCPNVPWSLGVHAELLVDDDGKLLPYMHKSVKIVSTGFMQPQGESIIIRGPIKHRLLTDFIEKTAWGELDVLVFDFPPGTSDVPLSAMQVANLTGILLVTTPQKSAVADVTRAVHMARKVGTPLYGLVENMTGDAFGERGEEIAHELGLNLVCSIPLSKELREKSEKGKLALSEYSDQLTRCLNV